MAFNPLAVASYFPTPLLKAKKMPNEYQDQLLTKPTSFRVPTLAPAKNQLNPLKGYFTEYFLDGPPHKPPSYEALSYVWNPLGALEWLDQIEVASSEELDITSDCKIALR